MKKPVSKLLMVDDDRIFTPLVKEYLEAKGFDVTLVHNAEDGLLIFRKEKFELCLLDVKMPIKNGFELAKEIQLYDKEMPFLFLTGELEKEKRIEGLKLGADDYITKPFSMEELFLRIEMILRRVKKQNQIKELSAPFEIGNYTFNATSRELKSGSATQKLSAIESRLLRMFCESPTGIIERETALRQIWNDEDMLHGRSLNVYVSKLRKYLKSDERIEILNVHGSGYHLVVR